MPEASIVVSFRDQYTAGVRNMANNTRAFSQEAQQMINRLRDLGARQDELVRKQAQLRTSTDAARRAMQQAQRAFAENASEINRTNLEQATEQYQNLQEQLRMFGDESRRVRREASQLQGDLSRLQNRAGSGGNGGSGGLTGARSMLTQLGQAGAINMAGQAVSQWANTLVGSALGSTAGSVFSSALSGAASGAAMGSMIAPGVGTAVGAAIGGGIGLLTGGAQVYEKQDDAYKSWYAGLYENASGVTDTSLSSGTTVAGSREQTQMAFAQRLGSDEAADAYLEQVRQMATATNYTYDEITGYSKLLLNSYGADETLGVLMSLSDATAGLNLNSSDVNMFISGLSRMRTTGKATQEYLNYFSERGVDVYQALADATGANKSSIAEMVTNGDISGGTAAQAILDYIDKTYGGLSEKLAGTYDALVDNLGDVMTDIDASMGEAYNEERGKSIAQQIETYGGELGTALQEANQAIGAGRAALENLADSYTEEALGAVLTGKETTLQWSDENTQRLKELSALYQSAMEDYKDGNTQAGALVESYLEEARALAEAQYDSSDVVMDATDVEKDLITAINENTSALRGWRGSYETSQALTKGRAAGAIAGDPQAMGDISYNAELGTGSASTIVRQKAGRAGKFAAGIDYVPYDNFPALLHQGERVQTAEEARSDRGNRPIVISGNSFTVREEADIDRVASALLEKIELAERRG